MIVRVFILMTICGLLSCLPLCSNPDYVHIPDPSFRQYCLEQFDSDQDGRISYEEAADAEVIVCSHRGICSLEGIQYFTSLKVLECNENQLTSIDLSGNTQLERLSCRDNKLTSLELRGNKELVHLICGKNQLRTLDLKTNVNLEYLLCAMNRLESLDISHCRNLVFLWCWKNNLQVLYLEGNPQLKTLNCTRNYLKKLDINTNRNLHFVDCSQNPYLKELYTAKRQKFIEMKKDDHTELHTAG